MKTLYLKILLNREVGNWASPIKVTEVIVGILESRFVGVAQIHFHPQEVPILKQN